MSIARNSIVGIATSVAVFGLGILVSVVLTRRLGAEQRGIYFLLVTTNALLAEVTKLGVGIASEALLARGRFSLREVNAVAMAVALAAGLGGAGAATAAFPALRESVFRNVPYRYVLVALLLLATTLYQGYWLAMMAGLGRVVLMNKMMLALSLANAALIIVLVGVLQLGIPGFLAAWAATYVSGTVAMIAIASRVDRLEWRPSRRTAAAVVRFGMRAHWGTIAHQILLRFDVYAVNVLVGTRAVGIYSLSTTLAERLWMPTSALTSSSITGIAQLEKRESALLTARVLRASLLLMVSVAVPLGIAAPWLIPAMYGAAFTSSVLPLVILLVGATMFGGMLVLQNYVVAKLEKPGLLSFIFWGQIVISVPLYLLLIRWHGIVGAALASTITYVAAFAAVLLLFSRETGMSVREIVVPRLVDFVDIGRVLRGPFAGTGRMPAGDAP